MARCRLKFASIWPSRSKPTNMLRRSCQTQAQRAAPEVEPETSPARCESRATGPGSLRRSHGRCAGRSAAFSLFSASTPGKRVCQLWVVVFSAASLCTSRLQCKRAGHHESTCNRALHKAPLAKKASRGFEPRSLDSESRVLTVTPRGRLATVSGVSLALLCPGLGLGLAGRCSTPRRGGLQLRPAGVAGEGLAQSGLPSTPCVQPRRGRNQNFDCGGLP